MSTARSEGSFSVFAPKEPGGLVSPKVSFESHYSRSCARTGEHLFCLQATVALLPCDYGAGRIASIRRAHTTQYSVLSAMFGIPTHLLLSGSGTLHKSKRTLLSG